MEKPWPSAGVSSRRKRPSSGSRRTCGDSGGRDETRAGLILIIGGTAWPPAAQLVRVGFPALRSGEFVQAARASGAPDLRIIVRHLLPNVVPVIAISATLRIDLAILTEAGLSFLGLGVQPPRPSWGNIIADGREYLSIAWWVSLFPGLCVFQAVIAFNLVGDGLRDAFDPRLQF